MRSLLLIAHGSRRLASNDEVRELAEKMNHMDHEFDQVSCAFLELAKPFIPEGIRELIEQGATEVVVLPYFLSAGRHVVEDVPADIAKVQAEYPEVNITMTPYLGSAASISEVVLKLASNSTSDKQEKHTKHCR